MCKVCVCGKVLDVSYYYSSSIMNFNDDERFKQY